MRNSSVLNAVKRCRPESRHLLPHRSCRAIQISASPTADPPVIGGDAINGPMDTYKGPADARFEVLGASYSLLSVSLSASQKLFTRRGTLVGLTGKSDSAQSTLSVLEPIRRAALGIPFLYQRVTSTTPITALISTKSAITSMHVIHLNGTLDWMVTQRNGLLAWTGHTLSVSPTINRGMSLAHWGNSKITGRGLVALAGPGQIYQVVLAPGEEYVAYPGNVLAYTITTHPPLPYRIKSTNLRFQIPKLDLGYLVPDTKFFKVMRESATWRGITNVWFNLRTAARRTIWGDRLFLQFHGPMTLLLSSRSSRISDVLTTRDINEIADSPAGALQAAVTLVSKPKDEESKPKQAQDVRTGFHVASVGGDGKVKFADADSLSDWKK